MFWLSFLCLLQHTCATPTPHRILSKREDGVFTLKRAEASVSKRDLKVTDNVLNLKNIGTKSPSSQALLSAAQSHTAPLVSVEQQSGYGVDVSLSGETFNVIFDTGSSDLWVAQTGFKCVEPKGNSVVQVSEKKCDFATLFNGQFSGGQIPDEHIIIVYGDGEEVAGVLGYEDVSLAGVTVEKQEMGSIEIAYFLADGVSGLMGFAYSTLTSAYKGSNITTHKEKDMIHYTNFIGNAIKQGLIDPLFSVVLERGNGQSQVALGGLPTISYDQDFTTVPLQIVEFSPKLPIGATKYTYYTIDVGGFVVDGTDIGSTIPMVVDTGTTLIYLPTSLADEVNAAFNPPAVYDKTEGVYITDCDATPPSFAVTIGGTNFKINAAEVLLTSQPLGKGLCATGITQSPDAPYILGDTFLKDVVAVFDIGASEMKFAPHENY